MAYLAVDLDGVCANYRAYSACAPAIPVLKNNAYGMGIIQTAAALRAEGAGLFACSTPEEALMLARCGFETLLLSCMHDEGQLRALVDAGAIVAVESLWQARLMRGCGRRARVHIAVDTGFGRFGFLPGQLGDMRTLFALGNIEVEGIFSHVASKKTAPAQKRRFDAVLRGLNGCPVGLRHLAATALALDRDYAYDAVRVGTGLTGRGEVGLKAARLMARVVSIRELPRGATVGYGAAALKRNSRVAVIDAGTGDGAFICREPTRARALKRLLSRGEAAVMMAGRELRVLGRPGLSHTMVDVTGVNCCVGDEVEIPQSPIFVPASVERRYESACGGMARPHAG